MKKLNEAIQTDVAARHKTLNQLAANLQIPSGSLRSWLSQNRFPAFVVQKLIEAGCIPNLPLSELEKQFDFKISGRQLRCDFESTDIEGIVKTSESYSIKSADEFTFRKMVQALFAKLQKGDIFWLFTNNEIPIEWALIGWQAVADEIISALSKGAHFFYLSPDTSGHHKETFNSYIERIVSRNFDQQRALQQIRFSKIGLEYTPAIGSKVAVFRETNKRKVSTLVNTRVPGERWINYRPSSEFTNHMLCEAFKVAGVN